MLDNKGRLFGKVNIIDLGVLFVLIIAVALCVLKFSPAPKIAERESTKFQYTLSVSGVRDFTLDAFQVGDELFEATAEKSVGKVVSVDYEKAKGYIYDVNGNIIERDIPERYELKLLVECDGYKVNGGYETVDGEKIQLNRGIGVFNKYCQTNFAIDSVKGN